VCTRVYMRARKGCVWLAVSARSPPPPSSSLPTHTVLKCMPQNSKRPCIEITIIRSDSYACTCTPTNTYPQPRTHKHIRLARTIYIRFFWLGNHQHTVYTHAYRTYYVYVSGLPYKHTNTYTPACGVGMCATTDEEEGHTCPVGPASCVWVWEGGTEEEEGCGVGNWHAMPGEGGGGAVGVGNCIATLWPCCCDSWCGRVTWEGVCSCSCSCCCCCCGCWCGCVTWEGVCSCSCPGCCCGCWCGCVTWEGVCFCSCPGCW